jgi:hypothetical protein
MHVRCLSSEKSNKRKEIIAMGISYIEISVRKADVEPLFRQLLERNEFGDKLFIRVMQNI